MPAATNWQTVEDMDQLDILQLAARYPSVDVGDGESVITNGEPAPALYVLASGELEVRAGGRVVMRLTRPGDIVGEIGLLLGTAASADVVAVGSTAVHRIDNAAELFEEYPGFGRHLAEVLARRLRNVTSFLGDIEEQFSDRRDTLGLVPAVLGELLGGSAPIVDPGSERERDSPY